MASSRVWGTGSAVQLPDFDRQLNLCCQKSGGELAAFRIRGKSASVENAQHVKEEEER